MGSTLQQNGRLVWSPSAGATLRAIRTFGDNIHRLRLPVGIGDEHPTDGVEAVALMPDLHVIPGLWTPMRGYDGLLKRLERLRLAGEVGVIRPFPYDWRLSNRYNARRLAAVIGDELPRWRNSHPARAEARVVLVCHSMGGLVARWYLEKCGGAEVSRKLVTLGTPFRGAARAVEQLSNGAHKGLGRLSVDLTEFARSLPALHQLLPDYACIEHANGLHRIDEIAVPNIDTAMLTDARHFHTDLADAEMRRPAALDMTHAIVGTRQPTATSLRLGVDGIEELDTIDGSNEYGDGTVPLAGAVGHGLTMSSNRFGA
ncbi:lecithin:cholesterol acyltransferase [Nocardia tenerifensis]|uniref:Lecithin:cholesterol acyltransferase n=2 Tax=Nocardia tenerifensis TaxID=228006 RepID=A0A318K7P3_9NOCA|nr:lecithin:cholesterol acyltransferase [Nocardia tenerifensis]